MLTSVSLKSSVGSAGVYTGSSVAGDGSGKAVDRMGMGRFGVQSAWN